MAAFADPHCMRVFKVHRLVRSHDDADKLELRARYAAGLALSRHRRQVRAWAERRRIELRRIVGALKREFAA